ncbi:hypothetical protein ACROYT_G026091 [Oculina patagonica]
MKAILGERLVDEEVLRTVLSEAQGGSSHNLADHYWRRWLREYLPTLQERQKWNNPRKNLAVDDLVVVVDENVPRGQWLLGRIVRVFPGKDEFVRSAEVKTKHSTLHRPIRKLCLLEASDA